MTESNRHRLFVEHKIKDERITNSSCLFSGIFNLPFDINIHEEISIIL